MHDDSTERPFPNGVLYLVVSGAPAPEGVPALVRRCQAAGWRVVMFSTPTGTRFIDPGELEQLTGEPVRSEYRMPGTGKAAPAALAERPGRLAPCQGSAGIRRPAMRLTSDDPAFRKPAPQAGGPEGDAEPGTLF